MKMSKALKAFEDSLQHDAGAQVEQAKLHFTLELEKQRRASGLSYAALANKIAKSAAYISKVFRGESNLTIDSMVRLAMATGGELKITVTPKLTEVKRWNLPSQTLRPDEEKKS